MKKQISHKLELMLHIFTAFILLVKGYDKAGHHHYTAGGIICGLAIIVLVIALFGRRMGLNHGMAKIICYTIESVALFITAFVLFEDGKRYLPYPYLVAAIVYLIVTVVYTLKHKPYTV